MDDTRPGCGQEPPRMGHLQLMVTRRCTLRCGYCRVDQRDHDMSPEVLDGAVELLFTSRSEELHVVFFGGEALLRPEIVARAIATADARAAASGRLVRYTLVTNGLLLAEEALRLFPLERVQVYLNASGGLDVVARRSAMLRAAGIWHCANLVVDPARVEHWRADLHRLAAAQVPRVELFPRFGVEWPKQAAERFLSQVEELHPGTGAPIIMNIVEPISPFLLHSDAVVDCAGEIAWSASTYLERDFPKLRDACRIGRVGETPGIDELWRPAADIHALLLEAYPAETHHGRLLRNNLELGTRLWHQCGQSPHEKLSPERAPRSGSSGERSPAGAA